jgi:pimeloyl-ACP methyl ester carboxylesterase
MRTRIGDITLAYDEGGSGIPLLFVHGFPHDHHLWDAPIRALMSVAHCIAPDLRGFGASDVAGPYSVERYADDLALLLDVLEIERAVVCGLSMGGYIAMAMWRRHPQRIRALALCDTRAAADTDEQRAARHTMITLARAEGPAAIAEKQIAKMVGATTTANRPDVVAEMRAMMERQPVEGIVGALSALRDRPDARDTIASITVPTLIVVGAEDALTPVSDAEAMHALLPASVVSRLDIVADAGHVPCVERPAAFTHAFADFLALPDVQRA